MSSPTPNPQGAPAAAKARVTTPVYDHIPELGELLPKQKGLPGFTYLQVVVENQVVAEAVSDEDGGPWLEVDGTRTYIITGPKGQAICRLYCRGRSIPGESSVGSRRVMGVDDRVSDLTGHPLEGYPKVEEQPSGKAQKPAQKPTQASPEVAAPQERVAEKPRQGT